MKKNRKIKKSQLFQDEDIDELINKLSTGFKLFFQSPYAKEKNKE